MIGGSPDLLTWLALGIWFALFSWLGTSALLDRWARVKGFEKLIKRESQKVTMLSVLNSFVEAFFIFLLFTLTAPLYLGQGAVVSFWLFYALLGVIVQIPIRVSLALTMNLPEKFLLGEVVGGIFKYIIGGLIMVTLSPL